MLTLQESSLDVSLRHALKYGDTDVFPIPFEYEAVNFDWDNVRRHLAAQNVLSWATRPCRSLLSPKAKYAFRTVTQLDPLDFLLFAATIKEIADDLEGRRIPRAENRVFSYRIQLNAEGQLFDPRIGYRQFLTECESRLNINSGFTTVAVTDISDFYSRIYHHRLENALQSATTHTSHVKAIMRLLSGWNGTETFGIPVGGALSRILAEVTISDVDEALLAKGVDFVRFNDDYRIFATSHDEAYCHIVFLAETLWRNHGLSLQPQKTTILTRDVFRHRYSATPDQRELESLHARFEQLIDDLGLDNWYEPIDYDSLEPEQQEAIDALNLGELFREEMSGSSEPDLRILKFVFRRLGQLADPIMVEEIFDKIEVLHPILPDIIHYLNNLRYLTADQRRQIGGRILQLFEDSILSELPYHKIWLLDLFTRSRAWNNEAKFFQLYGSEPDPACRRELILAMGRVGQRHWFQSQWRTLFDHAHWPRRALLASASCMPGDARRHWYRSIEPQLDVLETAVMKWARQNPFFSA